MVEWAGFEPAEYRSQSPVPYHLATILYTGLQFRNPIAVLVGSATSIYSRPNGTAQVDQGISASPKSYAIGNTQIIEYAF